jgi:Programmed cell death protein 2, C-terminal putative domain.
MAESIEDKSFSKFSERISKNPDQVLRYDRGGKPLWISSDHIPIDDDIPHCEYCGEKRQFEFQVNINKNVKDKTRRNIGSTENVNKTSQN